jgi:hypothetical protein
MVRVTGAVFTDATASLGINHVQKSVSGTQPMTGGGAAGDFDGDGLVDLFFTRVDGPDLLYRNTGNGFVDVSAAAGFTATLPTNGAAAGDIDNDGDLDLYVTASESTRYYLYVNDGAGHFTEQAVARGAAVTGTAPNRKGQGVALGDYDRDGYLDILTSDHSRPTATSGSRLLRNLGADNPGSFADVTQSAGIDVYRKPLFISSASFRFQPQFSDLDRDGRTDILFSSDSHTSQLFWNNGDGTFVDGTVPAGVGTDKSGMGTALGDYDNDGDLDWFVTAIMDTPDLSTNPGNRLYRNNGNRTFTDVTTAAGVREIGWGWGAEFLDFDNDGKLDLMATGGFPAMFPTDPTKLWANNGDGTFADASTASGVTDTGQGRGLLTLDYDNDGDLDAVVINYAAAPIVYRNDGGNDFDWLRVKTRGTISNRDGIGAIITVLKDADAPQELQYREISAGGSYLSQSEMAAHFGLGDLNQPLDLVTIQWPTGLVQQMTNVTPNQVVLAVEPLPGDFNGSGVVEAGDLVVWQSTCGVGDVAMPADFNGDRWVDGADMLAWQRWLGRQLPPLPVTAAPEPGTSTCSAVILALCAVVMRSGGIR